MRILASLRLFYKYQAYHSDAIKGMFLTDNVEDIVEFLGSKVFIIPHILREPPISFHNYQHSISYLIKQSFLGYQYCHLCMEGPLKLNFHFL